MKIPNLDTIMSILKEEQESHKELPDLLHPYDEFIPWVWVNDHTEKIANMMHKRHWHRVSGECMRDIPFELRMLALALFSTTWSYHILMRKARDRKNTRLNEVLQEFRTLLMDAMKRIDEEVDSTRDLEAETRFQKEYRKPNRLRCFINRLMWGH